MECHSSWGTDIALALAGTSTHFLCSRSRCIEANTFCSPGPQPLGQSSVMWVRAASQQGIARGLARQETRCSSPSLRCKTTSPGEIIATSFPKCCPRVDLAVLAREPPHRRDSSQNWLLSHPTRSRWIFQFSSLDGAGDSTAPG